MTFITLEKGHQGCSLLDNPWALHIYQAKKEGKNLKQDIHVSLWALEKRYKKLDIQYLYTNYQS